MVDDTNPLNAPEANQKLAAKIRKKYPELPESAVDAASRGMKSLSNFGRGLKILGEQIGPDAQVYALAQGDLSRRRRMAQGVVAVVDERVVAAGWAPGLVGSNVVKAIELKDITDVNLTSKRRYTEINVDAPGGGLQVKNAPEQAASWVAEAVRWRKQAAAAAAEPAHQPDTGSDVSIEGRLKRLEALRADGVISDDEYESKRHQILEEL